MKFEKKHYLVVLSIISFVFGIFFANISEIGLCNSGFCSDIVEDLIGVSLGFFSLVTFFLSLILLFTKEQVFNSWLKFSKIFLPIAIILIAIFPAEAGFLNPDKETVIWLTSGLFLVLSLIIIAVKSWRLRKGNQKA